MGKGKRKTTRTALRDLQSQSIALGIAVALGIVGKERVDILHRLDRDGWFLKRVAEFTQQQWFDASRRGRTPTDEDFKALTIGILGLHDNAEEQPS